MKLCYASGCGVCVNCLGVPPKINGYSQGDICRKEVEKLLVALSNYSIVCYNSDDNKFYEKIMCTHPTNYMDDDWEVIE